MPNISSLPIHYDFALTQFHLVQPGHRCRCRPDFYTSLDWWGYYTYIFVEKKQNTVGADGKLTAKNA